ncbi:MAG: hypothetical protein ABF306_16500 [Nocardioides marinisabuli]|uniref:hypothetical protein n=1 Tax=Nocardioides marinisabuli TaxID=419476 RepID=UPI00321AF2FD
MTLLVHAAALDLTLAGSVIAVPAADRLRHARSLTEQGHWVHADRIEGSYRGQAGVGLDEVHELAGLPDVRLDVHLMVDDLEADLAALPEWGIARVTLQCDGRDDVVDLVRRSRRLAPEVWLAVHDEPLALARLREADADGLLVMLTPPGRPGHLADLDRLRLVESARGRGWPAGVDGGVTDEGLERISAAGARYAVAGRALAGATS